MHPTHRFKAAAGKRPASSAPLTSSLPLVPRTSTSQSDLVQGKAMSTTAFKPHRFFAQTPLFSISLSSLSLSPRQAHMPLSCTGKSSNPMCNEVHQVRCTCILQLFVVFISTLMHDNLPGRKLPEIHSNLQVKRRRNLLEAKMTLRPDSQTY